MPSSGPTTRAPAGDDPGPFGPLAARLAGVAAGLAAGFARPGSFSFGVLALLSYFNFGAFHFPRFTHDWEWTHYYLGAKYFPELDYDKHECIAVADGTRPQLGATSGTATVCAALIAAFEQRPLRVP